MTDLDTDISESLSDAGGTSVESEDPVEFVAREDGTLWLRVPSKKSPPRTLLLPMEDLKVLSVQEIGYDRSLLSVMHAEVAVQEQYEVRVSADVLSRSIAQFRSIIND
jgi:hypothetical protein